MKAVLTGFRPVERAASGAVMLSDAVALWRSGLTGVPCCAPLHLPALLSHYWPKREGLLTAVFEWVFTSLILLC